MKTWIILLIILLILLTIVLFIGFVYYICQQKNQPASSTETEEEDKQQQPVIEESSSIAGPRDNLLVQDISELRSDTKKTVYSPSKHQLSQSTDNDEKSITETIDYSDDNEESQRNVIGRQSSSSFHTPIKGKLKPYNLDSIEKRKLQTSPGSDSDAVLQPIIRRESTGYITEDQNDNNDDDEFSQHSSLEATKGTKQSTTRWDD